MVQPAVADVVSPAVTAVHPHALLHKGIGAILQEFHICIVLIRLSESSFQCLGNWTGLFGIIAFIQPVPDCSVQRLIFGYGKCCFRMCFHLATHLVHRQAHSQAVFGIVFKKRVGRCRTIASAGLGIREGRRGRTNHIGATGSICNIHPLTKQLSHQFHVGCFAAARAGAVELIKRALELTALDREFVHGVGFHRQVHQVIPVGLLMQLAFQRLHHKCFFLGKAGAGTAAATLTIQRIHLDAHGVTLKAFAFHVFGNTPLRCVCRLFRRQQEGPDRRMRADERAHVAADAVFGNPYRHVVSYAAALVFGCFRRADAVGIIHEGGHGDAVTRLVVNRNLNLPDIFGKGRINFNRLILEGRPAFRNVNLDHSIKAGIHCSAVHIDNLVTLGRIGLHDGALHILHGLINGEDSREFEEGRLQHGVGAVAEADSRRDIRGVDGIEVDLLLGKDAFCTIGQMLFQTCHIPVGIQQESTALFNFRDYVKVLHVALFVAGHKIRHRDIVGRADGFMPETQVALGHASGLLGVILKVGLCILVRIVTDDLDGILVRANRTVRAETPEFAGDNALACRDNILAHWERGMGYIVINADGEVVFLLPGHVVKHSLDMGRDGIFGGQTVAPAQNRHSLLPLTESGAHIGKQGFACTAGFFGAVKNADALHACRQYSEQVLC